MPILQIQEVNQYSGFDSANDNLLSDKSQYGYKVLKYPLDLGAPDKGHYIVFFINQQDRTQFETTGTNSENPTVIQNQIDFGGQLTLENVLRSANSTKRTNGAICLYMPDTLAFDNSQSYSDINLGNSMAAAGATGVLAGAEQFSNGKGAIDSAWAGIKNAAAGAASVLAQNLAGDAARAAEQALLGIAQNPMMELIYTSPQFRTHRYDFMFYPRSSKESEEVQKIVELFKFHFAPEVLKASQGFFLVPPSQFDIKFYYNGKENPNIERTTTCVMTSINCDYAPNGWAAYEIPGFNNPSLGKTGSPVGIRLTMQFKEIEYMTKEHYKTAQYAFLGKDWMADYFGSSTGFGLNATNPEEAINAFINQVRFQG